jgi:hypothetical protein
MQHTKERIRNLVIEQLKDFNIINQDGQLLLIAGAVDSVNGQQGTITITTDDIDEGENNFYASEERINRIIHQANYLPHLVNGKIPLEQLPPLNIDVMNDLTTDTIIEGSLNEYFTKEKVLSILVDEKVIHEERLNTLTTDDIKEGNDHKYYSDNKVNVIVDNAFGQLNNQIQKLNTDDIQEGVQKQYYTNNRVINQLKSLGSWEVQDNSTLLKTSVASWINIGILKIVSATLNTQVMIATAFSLNIIGTIGIRLLLSSTQIQNPWTSVIYETQLMDMNTHFTITKLVKNLSAGEYQLEVQWMMLPSSSPSITLLLPQATSPLGQRFLSMKCLD